MPLLQGLAVLGLKPHAASSSVISLDTPNKKPVNFAVCGLFCSSTLALQIYKQMGGLGR